MPRYRQIYSDLKARITSGEYAPGSQLPYERVLCEQYGVERITIRRALELLVNDDLIDKRAGLGSFVKGVDKRSSGSGTILFIMLSGSNDIRHNVSALNALLFFAAEEACRARGYTLLYVALQPGDDVARLAGEHDASGLLLVSTLPSEVIQAASQSDRPAICLNHFDPRLMSIMPDNYLGASMAIDYLVKLGHRRIGYIDGLRNSTNATERREGYVRALMAGGMELDQALMAGGGMWAYDDGREAMRVLLERNPGAARPTAVFAASDMMAIGAMDEVRRQGLTVPDDISIIGFDNVAMCNFCSPKLTTIGTDVAAMADVAIEHLIMLMGRGMTDSDRYTIRLPVTFVGRDSTRPCPGKT